MTTIPTKTGLLARAFQWMRRRLRLLDCYSQLSGAHRDLAETQRLIDDLEPAQFADISAEAKAAAFKKREAAKKEALRCITRIDHLNQEIYRLEKGGF